MDAWNPDQLRRMQLGGNDKLNKFLQQYGVPKAMDIREKYNTKAAGAAGSGLAAAAWRGGAGGAVRVEKRRLGAGLNGPAAASSESRAAAAVAMQVSARTLLGCLPLTAAGCRACCRRVLP
jgi:hypothetical protein